MGMEFVYYNLDLLVSERAPYKDILISVKLAKIIVDSLGV